MTNLQSSRPFVLTAVRQNGMALEYAGSNLRENKSVVKAAVAQNGMALEFASSALRSDVNIAIVAARQNGMSLQFASSKLRNDKHVVLAAVRSNGMALEFASPSMQNDHEVVTAATLRDSRAIQFLGSDYTTGKKRLVVSCSSPKMEDVDAMADHIMRKVMRDASRDRTEECRGERQMDTRRKDQILESRSPKGGDGFTFFGSMKDYLTKIAKSRDKHIPQLEVREEQITKGDEDNIPQVEVRDDNPMDEQHTNNKKEKSFSFFETMGKYIDSTCETGCEMGQNLCQSTPEQKHHLQPMQKQDMIMQARSETDNDLVAINQNEKSLVKDGVKGDAYIVNTKTSDTTAREERETTEDGVMPVLKEKQTVDSNEEAKHLYGV
jgi:hypothetical protein